MHVARGLVVLVLLLLLLVGEQAVADLLAPSRVRQALACFLFLDVGAHYSRVVLLLSILSG